MQLDWQRWPNFSESEFRCSHCGKVHMQPEFLDLIQELRDRMGRPLVVTSGYRCPEYNNQISSTGKDGPHTTGKAVDFHVYGRDAHELLFHAFALGFSGIGINQKGATKNRFIHLDTLTSGPRPNIWTY